MELQKHTRRDFLRLASLSTAGVIVAACAGEPEIVEKIVKETVVVEKVVEKQVTVLVEKAAEGEVREEVEDCGTRRPFRAHGSPCSDRGTLRGSTRPGRESQGRWPTAR